MKEDGADWSDESKCQACQKEVGTEMHRLYRCSEWHKVRLGDSRCFQKVEAKSKNLKEGVEVAKRYCDAPSQ